MFELEIHSVSEKNMSLEIICHHDDDHMQEI